MMLVMGISSVIAVNSVDIGGDTFNIPPMAENVETTNDSCNFTVDNISASIIKIDQNELDNYIHSNRLKKYEVVRLSSEENNYYRYEDRLQNENGVITPIQKDGGTYIFKLYKYNSFKNSTDNILNMDKAKFMGIFRGFLQNNGYNEMIPYGNLPI